MVKVDVEYCGYCDFEAKCKDLSIVVKKFAPNAEVTCRRGRKGSFEVKIDDVLVHSTLQTLSFPDYKSVAYNVRNMEQGKPLTKIKEQQINDCVIL